MNQKRIEELKKDFLNAIERLSEAIEEDPSIGGILVDGTIQRFEFTFELAWKLAKVVLAHQGIDVASPRQAIKEAFKFGLIKDGDGWIDMLEDRNKAAHIYDEDEARTIYEKIINKHFSLLKEFAESFKSK